MKQNTKTMMRRLSILVATIIVVLGSLNAKDHKPKHELENMHVSIKATEYKTSRFIEKETIKGKEYIKGKSSSYNKNGEAKTKTILQPCAEYGIKTKLPGGTYNVTVYYAIDNDEIPDNPHISIGINTQKAEHIKIKKKLINSVKASFKVNFFKGNNHTVKVWFPSEGVKIREIKISRAIISKKE